MCENEDTNLIVKMSLDQVNLLIEEARRKFPIEICGALFGIVDGKEVLVKKISFLRNVLASRELFEIDPEEFLAELIESERKGLQHIGFFHSHPSVAEPSEIDLKFMRLWPGSIWLIISSLNRNISAYRIINGKLRPVYIKVLSYDQ